jgi:hypothetical protein
MTTKRLLTKYQLSQGLDTIESEDFVYLIDKTIPQAQLYDDPEYKTVATFSASGATIVDIQKAANDYIIERSNKQ